MDVNRSNTKLPIIPIINKITKRLITLTNIYINTKLRRIPIRKLQRQLATLLKLRRILSQQPVPDLTRITSMITKFTVEPPNSLIPRLNKQLQFSPFRMGGQRRLIDLYPRSTSIHEVTDLGPNHFLYKIKKKVTPCTHLP